MCHPEKEHQYTDKKMSSSSSGGETSIAVNVMNSGSEGQWGASVALVASFSVAASDSLSLQVNSIWEQRKWSKRCSRLTKEQLSALGAGRWLLHAVSNVFRSGTESFEAVVV